MYIGTQAKVPRMEATHTWHYNGFNHGTKCVVHVHALYARVLAR